MPAASALLKHGMNAIRAWQWMNQYRKRQEGCVNEDDSNWVSEIQVSDCVSK